MTRHLAMRDEIFPLRRANRYYTTDLRFMALRLSRLRRWIALYEFAGIDHLEQQVWVVVGRCRTWVAAAAMVADQRARPAVSHRAATEEVLDLSVNLVDSPRT